MTYYFAPMGEGLGDVVVGMPIIRALTSLGPTVLVQRSPRQIGISELVAGLAGVMREADFDLNCLGPDDRYINLREHKLQKDYFWGGPEFERDFPGFLINDIQKEMCRDFGIAANFDVCEPFACRKKDKWKSCVIFVPGTTYDAKTWSTSNWQNLHSSLKQSGYDVLMIGQPAHSNTVKELAEAGLPLLQTESLQQAVDAVSSARLVISVDTGLMHLAVQQGTVTLGLLQDPIFYRPYANSHHLLSKRCSEECVSARMATRPQDRTDYPVWEWDILGFGKCLLPESERCINSITVRAVQEKVLELAPSSCKSTEKSCTNVS